MEGKQEEKLNGVVFEIDSKLTLPKENHPLIKDLKSWLSKNYGSKDNTLVFSSEHKEAIGNLEPGQSVFMNALYCAYDKHYPLTLSPDTIWINITSCISKHIQSNSETLRDKFVKFSGKQKIVLEKNHYVLPIEKNPITETIKEFSSEIKKLIPNDIYSAIVCDFSTTNETCSIASQVVLMDSVEKFFSYSFMTKCGIPSIRLEGNINDWISMKKKLETFVGIGIDWWIELIQFILDQFIDCFNGRINQKFWKNIYKVDGLSGGPRMSGWFLLFYLNNDVERVEKLKTFNKTSFKFEALKNYNGFQSNEFSQSMSKVPVTWNFYGTEIKLSYSAGIGIISQDQKTGAIKPEPCWMIFQEK